MTKRMRQFSYRLGFGTWDLGLGIWSFRRASSGLVGLLALLAGCAIHPAPAPKATDIDPARATPYYWISRPAVAGASDADFFKLWNACLLEVRHREFLIDREDYREGLLTTLPMTTRQFWEVWRRDVGTLDGLADSSLASIRRTVRFEVTRQDDGTYVATPKVLVERYASLERRLTSITQYHTAFSSPRPTQESDTTTTPGLPTDYWYAVGRDEALEKDLAASIRARLNG